MTAEDAEEGKNRIEDDNATLAPCPPCLRGKRYRFSDVRKKEVVVNNRIAAAAMVVALIAVGVHAEGAEKKKGKTAPAKSSPTSTAPAAASGQKLPAGYKEVKTGSPELLRAAYKIDGRSIMAYFQNLSKDKVIRVKYQVTWKTNRNGNLVDDASMEGLSFRLKKQEDLTREVRTGSKDIKDVIIDVMATETE
jgi:hypothetical protein